MYIILIRVLYNMHTQNNASIFCFDSVWFMEEVWYMCRINLCDAIFTIHTSFWLKWFNLVKPSSETISIPWREQLRTVIQQLLGDVPFLTSIIQVLITPKFLAFPSITPFPAHRMFLMSTLSYSLHRHLAAVTFPFAPPHVIGPSHLPFIHEALAWPCRNGVQWCHWESSNVTSELDKSALFINNGQFHVDLLEASMIATWSKLNWLHCKCRI